HAAPGGAFMPRALAFAVFFLLVGNYGVAADPDPAAVARGRKALTETAFIKAFWPRFAVDNAWKTWGLTAKPADYQAAFQNRYGLHPAPYPNDVLPMGLRKANLLVGSGVGIDCMTCHGGSIFGKSIVGLGNSSLDIHSLFEELGAASGSPGKPPFMFTNARGTNEAGAFSVYLLGFRNPDLTIAAKYRDLGLHDDACEDVPAWWHLRKKRTMYHVGATDARSVRSIMQFMMHPLTVPAEFHAAEPAFRDIQQYLLSLEPPKYPFPVDATLAKTGAAVFTDNCVRCHGTYGDKWTYANKIVPLAEIGTDRRRFDAIGPKFGEAYNASWFAKEPPGGKPIRATAGYQAPPLDGVWATAPYFHNGSVPTLAGVLNSAARPKVFTRSFRTAAEDFDAKNVGWKVREVPPPDAKLPGFERRKVYDTTQLGRGNGGHTYGDTLTPAERRAVIEYLKTL
ncbi:MAG: c-type cytochrome, partial [Fimbriiglobus sp.]